MAPLSYGDYSSSRVREIYQSDIKSITISAPTAGSSNGSPIDIVYTLESDKPVNASVVEFYFSTNSGSTWSTCTADATDPDHEGTTEISADANGDSHTFVWDSAADLTTAFQSSTVRVRIRAADQESRYSEYTASSDFEVDMLPGPPTLISPDDLYFDADTTPDFIFTVPTDPGSDVIAFCIEIDDSSDFSSINLSNNSQDDLGRFMHRINSSPGTKNGANGQTYYVKGYTVSSFSGTAVSFSDLTDHHKDSALPSSLTNPQILILNRADRRAYIDPSSISSTGFTIYKSSYGFDTNALVDLIVFSGAAGSFDTYWVDITGLSTSTTYTYGVSPFDTDLLGNTIPGTIADCRPIIMEGNDCGAYISSVTDTGFTLHRSAGSGASTLTCRVCLRATPTEAYIHTEKSIAQFTAETVDIDSSLDDSTNGGASWPSYIPGHILSAQATADRLAIFSLIDNDVLKMYKSFGGVDTNATYDLHGHSEPDSTITNDGYYYTDVPSTSGVPDTYEGNYVRYRVADADALSVGFYSWRVRGANPT